jgi:hypothetical protein
VLKGNTFTRAAGNIRCHRSDENFSGGCQQDRSAL